METIFCHSFIHSFFIHPLFTESQLGLAGSCAKQLDIQDLVSPSQTNPTAGSLKTGNYVRGVGTPSPQRADEETKSSDGVTCPGPQSQSGLEAGTPRSPFASPVCLGSRDGSVCLAGHHSLNCEFSHVSCGPSEGLSPSPTPERLSVGLSSILRQVTASLSRPRFPALSCCVAPPGTWLSQLRPRPLKSGSLV